MSDVLDLHVASFIRDGHRILDDVRWRIGASEHWALLGPNGCGKSTLLSILSAYEWPTEGQVTVLGEPYGRCDMTAVKRRLGIVGAALSQVIARREPAWHVVASGLYALLGPYRIYDDEDRRRALAALEAASALELADRPFGLLSHGQRQRVTIARALVRKPELLVLDEPCEGLDPVARARFLSAVERLCEAPSPPTTIFVTHHLAEVPRTATHALVLRRGRVVSSGPLAESVTSETMSEAFEARCEVVREPNGRLHMVVVEP